MATIVLPGSTRLFPQSDVQTHMPFFDGEWLVFARSGVLHERVVHNRGTIWQTLRSNPQLHSRFARMPRHQTVAYRAWKLCYVRCGETSFSPLPTGLPDEAIECSPSFYFAAGTLHVSFLGGLPTDHGVVYQLYQMSGPSWSKLSSARPAVPFPTNIGFINAHHICFCRGGKLVLQSRQNNDEVLLPTPFRLLLRVSFRADNPNQLLFTGVPDTGPPDTLLYDMDSRITQRLSNSQPVYKPSVNGDVMLYALRNHDALEDYHIFVGKSVLLAAAEPIR